MILDLFKNTDDNTYNVDIIMSGAPLKEVRKQLEKALKQVTKLEVKEARAAAKAAKAQAKSR